MRFAGLSGLLHPELVHARECVGIFGFNGVPAVKIGHRPALLYKKTPVPARGFRMEFEAEKPQAILHHKIFDLWYCKVAFLHMKKQITAFTGAEKISEARDTG